MGPSLIRDDVQTQAKALGDPTRFRIFRYIFESGCPIGVAELTTYTQLNHNAVRQHLAVLAAAELVVEEVEERTRPGRPRLMYTPAIEVAGKWGLPSPYFRINTADTGQFERTLIVAEEGASVSYLEGCTAPMRDENQLHAAVVELRRARQCPDQVLDGTELVPR